MNLSLKGTDELTNPGTPPLWLNELVRGLTVCHILVGGVNCT